MIEILAAATIAMGVLECATYKNHGRIKRASRAAVDASNALAQVKIGKHIRRKEA